MLKKESRDYDENKEESSYHQDKLEEDSGRGSFEDICIAIAPCIAKTPTEDTRVLDVQDEAEFDNISEKGADNGEDSWDAVDDIRLRCGHSGSCGSCLNGDVCRELRDMDINFPIVELYEEENEKLVDLGALKKKEIEEVQSESLQTEIEALRFELKRLNSNEEYRERAFTNLREAIKKKDGQLKDLKDELDYARIEKNYHLYQIELLENKLKDSEESKENLRFECDELRVIFDELKEKKDREDNFAEMEKNYYLYQIELLEKKFPGSLELGKNRDEGLKSQLKCLEDELAKFRNKNKQIDVIYETPTVTIYKEKGKMALELSKTSDKENVEFKELLKQIEELTEQNKYLQETLITKTQAMGKEENPKTNLDAKQKNFKSGIKKLKKLIRQNQREIERVGMFAWQRGCDARDSALWMSLLKEERKELAYVRNSLKLQTQTSRDKERELENSKQRLQQKKTELVQAQEGLRHVSETAGALQNVVKQMDSILQFADSNIINSDIFSIFDDCDRDDLNDSANPDFSSLQQEDEREE